MTAGCVIKRGLPVVRVVVWGEKCSQATLTSGFQAALSTEYCLTWSSGIPLLHLRRTLLEGRLSQTFLQAAQQSLAKHLVHYKWGLDESLLGCSARARNSLAPLLPPSCSDFL